MTLYFSERFRENYASAPLHMQRVFDNQAKLLLFAIMMPRQKTAFTVSMSQRKSWANQRPLEENAARTV